MLFVFHLLVFAQLSNWCFEHYKKKKTKDKLPHCIYKHGSPEI